MTPVPNNMRRESFFIPCGHVFYEETGGVAFRDIVYTDPPSVSFHLRIPIIPQAHHLFAHFPTIQIGLFSFRFHLSLNSASTLRKSAACFSSNFRSAIIFHNVVPDHLLFCTSFAILGKNRNRTDQENQTQSYYLLHKLITCY